MTLRELFDEQARLIETGDVDALVAQFRDDAVLVRFDGVVSGREAIADFLAGYISARQRLVGLDFWAECPDSFAYHVTVEVGGERLRVHGAFVLREGLIWRGFHGVMP